MQLTELPNIGPVLAENLRRVGLTSAEEFRAAGVRKAFLQIRLQVDKTACFHQLTALAGAKAGIPKKDLPPELKTELRRFFNGLS
ncbi:MAG: competence protein TfoX [Oscillibacter sp.]|jgi:DNA transformation protein|nr:competence protein TfoX [Oscillibacter sp.]